ncbi:predicted protein [Chaetoceros tenuissimus]|uniref:Uncharacterized protein n=1 Tax=Chaetoceros tenuissimus TaxID=426638 RepID=A0AAD3D5S2_9STRA|nr:predicted protein [Chaetoceros tenuissimus]
MARYGNLVLSLALASLHSIDAFTPPKHIMMRTQTFAFNNDMNESYYANSMIGHTSDAAINIDDAIKRQVNKFTKQAHYQFGDLSKEIIHRIKTRDYSREIEVIGEVIRLLEQAQDSLIDKDKKDFVRRELEEWDRRLMESEFDPKKQLNDFDTRFTSSFERNDFLHDEFSPSPVMNEEMHVSSPNEKQYMPIIDRAEMSKPSSKEVQNYEVTDDYYSPDYYSPDYYSSHFENPEYIPHDTASKIQEDIDSKRIQARRDTRQYKQNQYAPLNANSSTRDAIKQHQNRLYKETNKAPRTTTSKETWSVKGATYDNPSVNAAVNKVTPIQPSEKHESYVRPQTLGRANRSAPKTQYAPLNPNSTTREAVKQHQNRLYKELNRSSPRTHSTETYSVKGASYDNPRVQSFLQAQVTPPNQETGKFSNDDMDMSDFQKKNDNNAKPLKMSERSTVQTFSVPNNSQTASEMNASHIVAAAPTKVPNTPTKKTSLLERETRSTYDMNMEKYTAGVPAAPTKVPNTPTMKSSLLERETRNTYDMNMEKYTAGVPAAPTNVPKTPTQTAPLLDRETKSTYEEGWDKYTPKIAAASTKVPNTPVQTSSLLSKESYDTYDMNMDQYSPRVAVRPRPPRVSDTYLHSDDPNSVQFSSRGTSQQRIFSTRRAETDRNESKNGWSNMNGQGYLRNRT